MGHDDEESEHSVALKSGAQTPGKPLTPASPLKKQPVGQIKTASQAIEELARTSLKRKDSAISVDDVLRMSLNDISKKNDEVIIKERESMSKSTKVIDKTKIELVIDHIISSEDKAKGEVISWSLIQNYINFAGGWSRYVVALICRLNAKSR